MLKRNAFVSRKTGETDISIKLNIDGRGIYNIDTGIGFLNHMLSLFAKHGLFDLDIKASGDLDVDLHHTNEDIGLVLGETFKKALGSGKKIKRFGYFCVPMDESLVRVTVDISGRPGFYISGPDEIFSLYGENYNFDYAKHFLSSFLNKLQANAHIEIIRGENFHHVIEALFKCLGKVLDYATLKDDRIQGIPSTKGIL